MASKKLAYRHIVHYFIVVFHELGRLPQQNPAALPQFPTKMNSTPDKKWHGFDKNDPEKRCSQKNKLWKLMFERLDQFYHDL